MAKSPKERLVRLLRWSEQYTKTDMVYLTHGGFWLGLGHAFQMANGLILSVALANFLPKDAYGVYQFIVAASSIIGGLTLTGLGTALMRSVAQGMKGGLRYASVSQLRWSVGSVAASLAAGLYYLWQGSLELSVTLLVIGACMPFFSAFGLYRPYLEGKKLFKESTTLGMWRRPLPIFAVLAALIFTRNPFLLVLTYFVAQTVSMGLLYLLVARRYPEPRQEHPEMLNYGKHLSAMGIVGLVINNIDKVLIYHYLGTSAVAIFALAQLPLMQMLNLFGLAGNLVFPKFAQRDFGELRQTIWRKLAWFVAAAVAATAGYLVAAPYIFDALFPAYPEAILVSQVLMLSLLTKPFTLYGQAFSAHGFRGTQYVIQISTCAAKVALLVGLLPVYGLWGAVFAALATSLYWAAALAGLFYARKA